MLRSSRWTPTGRVFNQISWPRFTNSLMLSPSFWEANVRNIQENGPIREIFRTILVERSSSTSDSKSRIDDLYKVLVGTPLGRGAGDVAEWKRLLQLLLQQADNLQNSPESVSFTDIASECAKEDCPVPLRHVFNLYIESEFEDFTGTSFANTVDPLLIGSSKKLSRWARNAIETIDEIGMDGEHNHPFIEVLRDILDMCSKNALALQQSAAVERRLVTGILDHQLLESLDSHFLELHELAHAHFSARDYPESTEGLCERYKGAHPQIHRGSDRKWFGCSQEFTNASSISYQNLGRTQSIR